MIARIAAAGNILILNVTLPSQADRFKPVHKVLIGYWWATCVPTTERITAKQRHVIGLTEMRYPQILGSSCIIIGETSSIRVPVRA